MNRPAADPAKFCNTFWGSHGCDLPKGHDGVHKCDGCYWAWEAGGVVLVQMEGEAPFEYGLPFFRVGDNS